MLSLNRILISFLAVPLTLAAQSSSASIGGPIVGLVVDSNARLRPVLGVPGSASLGNPIALDSNLRVAALSPRHDYALAFRGANGELVIVREPLGPASVTVVDGVSGGAHVSLSPTGSSAVVQSSDGRTAQVIGGLPDSPTVVFQADLSLLPGASEALAVSDDGKLLLTASPDGDHVSIFLITGDTGSRVIASAGQLSGLAFVARHSDALFIDTLTNQASVLRDVAGSVTAALLVDGSAGDSKMIDTASSEDGATIFIANAGGVLVVDAASGAQRTIGCDCAPVVLSRLSRLPVFRLTDAASGGLIWIFDGGGANPRIVAIPSDPAGSEAAQ